MTTTIDDALLDLYAKKTARGPWGGKGVALELPLSVFSSYHLDTGTLALLRDVAATQPHWTRALDLGCGYGPIALALSAAGLAEQVEAVDRDALAVAFTQRNAARNKLKPVNATGGLAYEPFGAVPFDAILSNLPAKAGDPVHRMLLLQAGQHLTETGEVWVVVVKPLEAAVDAILADDRVEVMAKITHASYLVYRYRFSGPVPPDAAPYVRTEMPFERQGHAYDMTTLFGLPEFDDVSAATEHVLRAAAKAMKRRRVRHLAVWDPGQGHLPVLLARMAGHIESTHLLSRDALGLKASADNLCRNAVGGVVSATHAVAFDADADTTSPDLIAGVLNEKEGVEVYTEKIGRALGKHPDAAVIIGCPTAIATRLHNALRRQGTKTFLGQKKKRMCVLYRP